MRMKFKETFEALYEHFWEVLFYASHGYVDDGRRPSGTGGG